VHPKLKINIAFTVLFSLCNAINASNAGDGLSAIDYIYSFRIKV